MFNYGYPAQGPAFQRPAYQQPIYTPQPMPVQQPMMQDGMIQARFVSGREEAVASNVIPGSMFIFHDRAHGMIYTKLIDPQTGMPDFRAYAEMPAAVQEPQQTAPQYVTVDDLNALKGEIERRFEALTTSTKKANGKVAVSDDV